MKINKNSSLENISYLHRYSMLSEESSLICDIITEEMEINTIEDLYYVFEANSIQKDIENNIQDITSALKNLKNKLTEKQFSKISDEFEEIEDFLLELK